MAGIVYKNIWAKYGLDVQSSKEAEGEGNSGLHGMLNTQDWESGSSRFKEQS